MAAMFGLLMTSYAILMTYVMCAAGSLLVFEKNPDIVTLSLTSTMSLRCSLNDTPISGGGGLVGRDLTSTANNINNLISINIQKNGVDIASVTQFSPAKTLQNFGSPTNVTGDISGQSGERGFLSLTLDNPGEEVSGNYSCEANGIDEAGHNIRFSKSFMVTVRQPSLSDLVEFVRDQDIKIQEQQAKYQDQELRIQDQEIRNQEQHAKIQELEMKLNDEVDKIDNSSLSCSCNESMHVDSGVIDCGGSSSWTHVSYHYSVKTVTRQFKTSYQKAPLVQLSVMELEQYHSKDAYSTLRFYLELVNITSTDFTMNCKVYDHYSAGTDDHAFVLNELKVSWISFSQNS